MKVETVQADHEISHQRIRYSDSDLKKFKILILTKIEEAKKNLKHHEDAYRNNVGNGTNDTAPTHKDFDDGNFTLSKQENGVLAQRTEKYIRDLHLALVRIENKTYGICRVTKKLIPKERLKLVPHATLSIEAKINKE